MKTNCKIIEDLLPLYIDGVCSNESKVIVEEHLKECEACNEKLRAQKSEIIVSDNIIKENLMAKKPFKRIKRYQRITIYTLLVVMIASIVFLNSNLILHGNTERYIERMTGHSITVKGDIKYIYKGKTYRIILSTQSDNKDEFYMQCFEEKLGGLLYKPSYAASRGGSKSLYGFTKNFVDGSNDNFVIVYGYNKNFKANSFSVQKANDNENITCNISNQEFFLYAYTDIIYPKITFKDKQNNDITLAFVDDNR